MLALATDGILSYFAYVQVREEGEWVSVCQGSSVEWLTETAQEEADFLGESRVVDQFGDLIQKFTAKA